MAPIGAAAAWTWRTARSTVYAVFMLASGGTRLLTLSAPFYAPGTILFVITRSEQNRPVFNRVEWHLFGVIVAVAVAGLYGLAPSAIAD